MSILIKGIDMPPVDSDVIVRIWGTGYIQRIESYHSYDVPDGKAIELPPHGRLGDLDALKDVQQADADFFKGSNDYGEKCRRDEAINAVANIVNAPTIIEAEEGE